MKRSTDVLATDKGATKVVTADVAADEGVRQLLQRLADIGALPDGMLLVLVGDDDCDVRLTVLQEDPEKARAVLERLKLAVDATLGGIVEAREEHLS